ncbi:MAG TPA: uracil-DNA glycosylase [bacterium]|nr:uracil-DNA glycosylase [bacterium]
MKIEELNKIIRGCKKCRLSETRTNAICGEGNLNAKIMLIAQAPGEKEDIEGKMFVGPSGKVIDELLNEAGIKRDEIYMTNLIKCMLPKNRKPKQDEIEACSHYLNEEIKLINPKILAPLGYYATCYIFKKYNLPSPSKAEFSSIFGKLFLAEDKKILPLPHPATCLYNPEFKKDLIKSYRKLKVLLNDCKWYPVCPMKRFYEEGKLDKKWIELYCKGDWESCVRYQMEEKGEFHPDWMLPDGSLDERLKRR